MQKFKKLIRWSAIIFSYLVVFLFGMYCYKNEDIRKAILSIRNIKNLSYSNYRSGQDSQPPTIQLIIPDSSKQVIEKCRDNALKDNILRDENKQEVPAQLVFCTDTFEVDMRLKGDYSDHWAGEKWSYRIDLKGDNRLFGMKSFSIQDPLTRGNLDEWYFHELLRQEDLIALRYEFVSLTENGVEKGIYAVEESFDKELIEFNNRRNAPILKFDESIWIDNSVINSKKTYSQENLFMISKIDLFEGKKVLKDPVLYDQFQKGKLLLEKLRSREIPLKNAIDIDRAAKLFALADLTGGHHGLRWKNVRFYFNPVVGKLELIGFDSNSGTIIPDIYYNLWSTNQLGEYVVKKWKDIFYEEPEFVELYFIYLKKYSDPTFLEKFHTKIEPEMDLYLSYLYKENSSYKFPLENYVTNAKLISEKVAVYDSSKIVEDHEYFVDVKAAKQINFGDTEIQIELQNNSFEPIEVLGIFDPNENKISTNPNILITNRKNTFYADSYILDFNLNISIDSSQIKLKKSVANLWVHKKIKLGYVYVGHKDTNYLKIERFYQTDIAPHSANLLALEKNVSINDDSKSITIKSGQWEINENISTPEGYKVIGGPGTNISITNGATLVINGPIEFIGTVEQPITISSKDSSGSFLVLQAKTRSTIEHTKFHGLSESHEGRWHLTGAVTFYESDVTMNYVDFSANKSEDALNTFRCDFLITNSSFNNTQADAFDGDFCTGKLESSKFNLIGNDAVDFSGSTIHLKEIEINHAGDKGVSAGERSRLIVENITITNSELGLVSKDCSYLKVTGANLSTVSVGYIVFKKKGVFGSALIELFDYVSSNSKEAYLVETGSYAFLEGVRIKPNFEDVISILYGQQYGKSSK